MAEPTKDSLFMLQRLVSSCRRQWKFAVLVFLALFVPMAFVAVSQPTLYTATAKIMFENDLRINMEMSTVLTARDMVRVFPLEKMNSMSELIKSTTLLRDLIAELELAQNPEEEQQQLIKLQNKIKVRVVPASSVIAVSYSSENPVEAKKIVNALVKLFQSYYLRLVEGDRMTDLYQSQYTFADDRIKKDLGRLHEIRADIGIVADVEEENKRLTEKLRLVGGELDELDVGLEKNKAKASVLKRQLAQEPNRVKSSVDMVPNPEAAALRQQLNALTSEKDDLLTKYTYEQPDVKRILREIASLQARLNKIPATIAGKTVIISNPRQQKLAVDAAQVQTEINQFSQAHQQLSKMYNEGMTKLKNLDEATHELTALEESISTNLKARRNYSNKLIDAFFMESLNRGEFISATVIDSAITSPGKNRSFETALLSFVLSLVITLCIVFLRDWRRPAVHSADDVRDLLKVPVLATIPNYGDEHLLLEHNNNKEQVQPT